MHPDTHINNQFKYCTVISYCLRDSLYHDAAPVLIIKITIPGYVFCTKSAFYRDRAINQSSLYLDCKNTCHTLRAPGQVTGPARGGVLGFCPDAASGNTTSPYCRAVRFKYESSCNDNSKKEFPGINLR